MRLSGLSPRRSGVISLCVIGALLAISVFIYSPWHLHNRSSRQICSFSQFDYGSSLQPSIGVQIEPPVAPVVYAPRWEVASLPPCDCTQPAGRAPPA